MARFGRGLICLTLTRERCTQLRLPLMVSDTDRERRTNFTVSIEAAEGVTTGISAYDRAHTVRTAVAPNARPEDLRQPGHIFPVMAQPGGVLTRAGHTEAGCDLARLAGLEPAAVIVEIMNDDGTMARRPDLETFAKLHGLKIGTIARPDPLPAAQRALGRAHRRAQRADRVRRIPAVLLRRSRASRPAPGADPRPARRAERCRWCACISPTRCATCSACATRRARLDAARRDAAHRRASPRRAGGAARTGIAARAGGCHPAPATGTEPAAPDSAAVGAAHLRHRCADPEGPGRAPDARAVGAEAVARHLGLRPGSGRVRGPTTVPDRRCRITRSSMARCACSRAKAWQERPRRIAVSRSSRRASMTTSSIAMVGGRAVRVAAPGRRSRCACCWCACPAHSSCRWSAGKLAASGRYDAVIALGCVIRGDTPHFDFVAGEGARGIQDVGAEDRRAGHLRRADHRECRTGRWSAPVPTAWTRAARPWTRRWRWRRCWPNWIAHDRHRCRAPQQLRARAGPQAGTAGAVSLAAQQRPLAGPDERVRTGRGLPASRPRVLRIAGARRLRAARAARRRAVGLVRSPGEGSGSRSSMPCC